MKEVEVERRDILRVILFAGGALLFGCRTVNELGTAEAETNLEESGTVSSTVVVTEVATETIQETVVLPATLEATEVEISKPYFNTEEVRRVYVLEGEGGLEELMINPLVMEAVRVLGIKAEGDVTNLLIRAIPVDNADKQVFPDTLGLHFSENYMPAWLLVLVRETEVRWFIGMRQDTLVDETTAVALVRLQKEAFPLGFPAYLAFAFRDDQLQEQLREEARGSGVARARNSEHLTGLAVDLYADFSTWRYPEARFVSVANRHGFVSSISYQGDPPHFFYLDGVWPGLTQALIEAGIDPNNRRNSVDARIAVFRILVEQAEARYKSGIVVEDE